MAELIWMPYLCWGIHAVIAFLAVIFWIFEKPSGLQIKRGENGPDQPPVPTANAAAHQ